MARARAPDLHRVLVSRATDKLLRFDRFMETVLYEPGLGYYERNERAAGREGDFLTAPEVADLFGECVADWIAGAWAGLGRPRPFHLVEVGAGRGTLAASVLAALPADLPWEAHLVERGAAPRRALQERFAKEPRVRVHDTVDALPGRVGSGVFVANELFDNLPVRRIMMADGWKEIHVRIQGDRLREELLPAPRDLVVRASAHGLQLDEGQAAEVCEGAVPLLEVVLSRFDRGGLLVFDYGGEAAEVSGEAAPNGTLSAFRGHSTHPDLYSNLGNQDVTAHVNFTPLRAAAERLGYAPCHLDTQARFLLARGLPERLHARIESTADAFGKLRLTQYAKQLYHPEAMGESFRVMYAMKRQ